MAVDLQGQRSVSFHRAIEIDETYWIDSRLLGKQKRLQPVFYGLL